MVATISLMFLLAQCANVQKKIDAKSQAEHDKLSVYIGKNIESALIDFGKPFSSK